MYNDHDEESKATNQTDNLSSQPSDTQTTEETPPANADFQPKANNTAPNINNPESYSRSQPSGTYNEPWKEPVYRVSRDNAPYYSPGIHPGVGYGNGYSQNEEIAQKAENKHRKTGVSSFVKILCLVLVCALVSATASVAASYWIVDNRLDNLEVQNQVVLGSSSDTSEDSTAGDASSVVVNGEALSANEIYDLSCEQVVGVKTSVTTTNVFGQGSSSAVSGSGFVISSDGYIMTNYHVIEYAAQGYDLSVIFYDGSEYAATVVAYDEANDVAVIKIDADNLNAITVGDSDAMNVGETIYTIGNPLGELAYTMTSGIVSALDRLIAIDATTSISMFQIDAAVNAGNSGGPVYNSNGEVIGIVTAKYSSSGVEGLGFAIPINEAMSIAQQLIQNGYVSKAQLGITAVDVDQVVSSMVAEYYNIPNGAWVYTVVSGSCAEKAGIAVGDIITALNDTTITCTDDLVSALKNYAAGDAVSLTIFRSGDSEYNTIEVVLDDGGTANSNTSTGSDTDTTPGANSEGTITPRS